jgi:hypothetical protein
VKFSAYYACFVFACGLSATPLRAQSATPETSARLEVSAASIISPSKAAPELPMKTIRLTKPIVLEKIPHRYSTRFDVNSCAAPAESDNPDKGLQHRFHIAIGVSSLSNTDGNSSTASGFAAKVDWSYFRPTRHEAVATLWFVNASGSNTEALTTEYRWRFGGHGIGYYALGLGVATGNGLQSGVFTDGLGVELGRFTLEIRSLSSGSDAAYMFMVGGRF